MLNSLTHLSYLMQQKYSLESFTLKKKNEQ